MLISELFQLDEDHYTRKLRYSTFRDLHKKLSVKVRSRSLLQVITGYQVIQGFLGLVLIEIIPQELGSSRPEDSPS